MKTNLQQYFKKNQEKGVFDYEVRATGIGDKTFFYIHPKNVDGETLDFAVESNNLKQIYNGSEVEFKKSIILDYKSPPIFVGYMYTDEDLDDKCFIITKIIEVKVIGVNTIIEYMCEEISCH